MAREAAGKLVHFEVHALRGARWTIELALEDGELALERAQQILQQAEIDGIKVWKEIHDSATGGSAGRVVRCELKPKPRERSSFHTRPSWPAADDPGAALERRRRVAAPPPRPAAWPVAWLSIGGGCAALVALAVLATFD